MFKDLICERIDGKVVLHNLAYGYYQVSNELWPDFQKLVDEGGLGYYEVFEIGYDYNRDTVQIKIEPKITTEGEELTDLTTFTDEDIEIMRERSWRD